MAADTNKRGTPPNNPGKPDYESIARRFLSHSLARWHEDTLSVHLYQLENAIQEGNPPEEIRDQYFALLAKWGEYLAYFTPPIAELAHIDDDQLRIIESGYENLQWLMRYARSTTPCSGIDETTAYLDATQSIDQTLCWLENHQPTEDTDGN